MKQSILKKNFYHTNNHLDPAESNSSQTNSIKSSLDHSRPVQTSKNVRFIGVDSTGDADKSSDKANFSITRPVTGPHLLNRNSAKKNAPIPIKQLNFYSKPDDSVTFFYQQQNPSNNYYKNKNHIFYQQQHQVHHMNSGLRITSASIENRFAKSSLAKKNPNESLTSTKQSATNVTPIRTPILISNLLASANSLSTNSHEKTQNTSYYYYFNRSNTDKNLNLTNHFSSKSPVSKLKLKELTDLERIGSSNDQSLFMSPRSTSDHKLANILPMRSVTPSLDDSIHKNSSSSTLTLYAYLLQNNNKLPKDVRASLIRSQTKQLNLNQNEIDSKPKLTEESSRRFRLKKDIQSDQFIKLNSRVSSASANTQLSNEENGLAQSSLTGNETSLVKS